MNVFKKIITYTCSISMLCLLAFIGMAISINDNMTEKASAASCLGTSGAQNVRSVQQACERCEDGRAPYGSGALWFNDSKTNKNSDVVTLTNAEASKDTVKIYLWGQYYSCGSKNIGSNNTAMHIWFGEVVNGVPYDEGNSKDGVNGVNFILENNASKKLYRGKVVSSYAWLQNGSVIGGNIPIKLNVSKFKEYARTHGTAPSKEEEAANHGGGTYIADVSVNRCSNDPYDGAYMNPSPSWSSKKDACYGDISTITVIIEPDDTETKVEEAGQVRFVSQSIVHTDPQGDISNHTEESSVNGNDIVTLYLSTESDTVNVQFQHKMKYLRESRSSGGVIEPLSSLDQLENGEYIKTNFTVNRKSDERSGDPEANKEVGSGTYPQPSRPAVTKDDLNNGVDFTTVNGYNSYTIKDLKPGETVKVCERIEFRNAIFPLEREEKLKRVPAYAVASPYHGQALYRKDKENDSYYSAGNAYYHYGTLPDGSWGLIQGASIGDDVFDSNGESLYEIAYVGMGEYVGQAVYKEQYVEVPKPEWGGAIYSYTTYVPTSIHHYDYNSNRWVPGYDKDGWNAGPNGEALFEQNYEMVHESWIYRPNPQQGEDGSYGFSAACISVTRPEGPFKPGDNDPNGEKVKGPYSGELDEGFLYAGETTKLEWNVAAMGYATRRIIEARAIVYQPTVNTIPKDDISKGNLGFDNMRENKLDPCTWYNKKVKDSGGENKGCVAVDRVTEHYGEGFYGIPFALKRLEMPVEEVIIPDHVGDKLCNSFGFRFQYWYGVTHENDSGTITEENWAPEVGREYWANYDAACRTIVKKPSLNVWNGSLFTNSDIATIVANRYTDPRLGDTITINNDSSRNIFGSWSEYLVVPYGKIKAGNIGGFASGASLGYRGFGGGNANLLANISPLTIANSGPSYGESGIISGSTYRARLSTYLKSLSTLSDITELYGKDINESKIIHVEGDINITDNIKLSSTERPSVYGLPQVIIFADGDINIKPNVSRIDAWLISGGTVYTCDEFVEGKAIKGQQGTEAYVKDYRYSGDTRCSQQLTINGPVIAKKLVSNRSAGSDPINYGDASQLGGGADARALPGEVFNLGADAYLWSYAQAGRYDSSYSESYIRELPPRY